MVDGEQLVSHSPFFGPPDRYPDDSNARVETTLYSSPVSCGPARPKKYWGLGRF